MGTGAPYFLLYDGDCRVCSLFGRIVSLIDIRRRIRVQPIQESRALLRGISEEEILDAAHVVAPDGRVTTGADAMPTLLGALLGNPGLERPLRSSATSMRLFARFYGILVELRGHLTCGFPAPASAGHTPR